MDPGPTGTNDSGTSVFAVLVNLNDETQIISGGPDLDSSGTAWRFRFMCDTGNYLLRVETFEGPPNHSSDEKELIINNSDAWPCETYWHPHLLRKFVFDVQIREVNAGAKTIVKGTTKYQNGHLATERVYGMILRPGHGIHPVVVGRTIKHGPEWEVEFNGNINSFRPCALRVRVRQPGSDGYQDMPFP
jgi:hypothetical protein